MTDQKLTDALSVSAALDIAKSALEAVTLTIVGEVSELSDNPRYSAVYFTLSDQSSALPCVMWRNTYSRQEVELRRGMLVQATGRFTLYAAKGRMNFDVRSLKPVGEGELRMRVAALARKLEAEGLMAEGRKQPVPRMPERIGLVTSPSGKAVHDVLRTLRRRWPLAEVLFAGVTVEGETAAEQMMSGLSAVQAAGAEVILLVRGGGSYEDLMPFNDERLARHVAACPTPIVTGIGHEPDNSIVDMVADFRASTPTAAAERVSPNAAELATWLEGSVKRLDADLRNQVTQMQRRIAGLAAHPLFTDDAYMLRNRWLNLEHTKQRLIYAGESLLAPYNTELATFAAQLEAFSPLGVLSRGYALTTDTSGKLIRSVAGAEVGQQIEVRLSDGKLTAEISEIRSNNAS
ncbi:MAG: exodeoxyribonuclease VII large subunit [Coriobacteriia bacterium]|nr:exodeoxyribonuclease VII large subunit [Coriobacteriia bacterium]